MEPSRWKKASLAIDTIIRGLELDQVVFQYDETACHEITSLGKASVSAPSEVSKHRLVSQERIAS